ncbi:MAG: hypothetical protein ACT4O9_12885 [Blastocatellia bacterium]
MRKRNHPRPISPKDPHIAFSSIPWRYFILTIICACILAAGFFFAARQHFISMEFGFKNSTLRKQLDDLETEKRRLMLAREMSLSPGEIRKTARLLGFREINPELESELRTSAVPASAVQSTKPVGQRLPSVKAIVYQKPAVVSTVSHLNSDTLDKQVKKTAKSKPATIQIDRQIAKLR